MEQGGQALTIDRMVNEYADRSARGFPDSGDFHLAEDAQEALIDAATHPRFISR